jgi:putative inorganic carbon (hco3(-)) transporter
LLGVGAGNFPVGFGQANGGRWMTAHSIYFLLLGELGFPGLMLLLVLIYANLAANRRLQRQLKIHDSPHVMTMAGLLTCTSASLVGFAVAGAFLSAAYYPHVYVICGLLAATRYVVRRELVTEKETPRLLNGSEQSALVPAVVRPGAISPEWRPRPIGAHGTSR